MPKEYIITNATYRRAAEQGGPQEAIRVGWNRAENGGFVQVASVLLAGGEYANGDPEQGQFVDMDRESLNTLIRILRRARDQAYGRDE